MRIVVAIPTFIRDIENRTLRRCLDSIQAQTRKPDLVAISASSCSLQQIAAILPPADTYSFPIRFQITERRQTAATNRNVLIELLKDFAETTDIVSFFDSDDVMSPLRLEYIERAFQTTSCGYVLHDYLQLRSPPSTQVECPTHEFIVHPNAFRPDGRPYCSVSVDPALNVPTVLFGPGHVSVRADILRAHRYKESTGGILWEDSEFVRDIAYAGHQGSYLHMPLAVYHNYRT
jgi:glycosyltransferase involved in cell wall biosynthesis